MLDKLNFVAECRQSAIGVDIGVGSEEKRVLLSVCCKHFCIDSL